MADTYSSIARVLIMGDGLHESDWGDRTSDNLQILEQAIDGYVSVALPVSGTHTLTTNPGIKTGDEARQKVIKLTGTPTAAVNVVVQPVHKLYLFRNSTSGDQNVTVSTSGGTTVPLERGYDTLVFCDSIDCFLVNLSVQKEITSQASDISTLQTDVTTLQAQVANLSGANPAWPVGSCFFSHVATNPATLLGYGTWSRIASGRFIVGQTDGDSDFNSVGETGGSKTRTLTSSNLPAHSHSLTINLGGAHTHTLTTQTPAQIGSSITGRVLKSDNVNHFNITTQFSSGGNVTTSSSSAHSHTGSIGSTGSGSSFEILPPYYVLYAWRRIA